MSFRDFNGCGIRIPFTKLSRSVSGQRLFGPQVNWASQPLDYNLEEKKTGS